MDHDDILSAKRRLTPYLSPSPLIHSTALSRLSGAEVWLKLESLQPTGSFKIRGALNRLLMIPPTERAGGVKAASAGNHAQGVALAASKIGLEATIFMPRRAPIAKQESTRGLGARLIPVEGGMDQALAEAARSAKEGGLLIHPFEDEGVIAGQGTIGLELTSAGPDVVVAPVGGGGLLAGLALGLRGDLPGVKLIGVQTESAPSAVRSFEAGRVVGVSCDSTVADGIAVSRVGQKTFEIIRRLVDGMVVVTEDQILAAMLALMETEGVVAEGAGAAPVAGLSADALGDLSGKKVVLIISGSNVDVNLLGRIIHKGLVRSGRILRLRLDLGDYPGSLARLTAVVAEKEANILDIDHDRLGRAAPVDQSRVELDLEVRGPAHGREFLRALEDRGWRPVVLSD